MAEHDAELKLHRNALIAIQRRLPLSLDCMRNKEPGLLAWLGQVRFLVVDAVIEE